METGSHYRTDVLERLQLFARVELKQCFGEEAELAIVKSLCGRLIMTVRQDVWSQAGQEFKCSYPADWWQAFKDRWFPGWLLVRCPVVYKTEGVALRLLYPQQAFPHYKVQLAQWDGEYFNWNRSPVGIVKGEGEGQ